MTDWRAPPRSVMPVRMRTPTPMAGGFFLILPIVVGFGWGLAIYRPMQGAIVGLGVGLVLALIVWALDRLRQRR